jgi:hypothetical protein
MRNLYETYPAADLVLVLLREEEGLSESGLYLDHDYEHLTGYAFGYILVKAEKGLTPDSQFQLDGLELGDMVLFTRGSETWDTADINGQECKVAFVNVDSIEAVLTEEQSMSDEGSMDGSEPAVESAAGAGPG